MKRRRRPKKREITAEANRVLAFRKGRSWDQQKAASFFMCSARTWRRYERGELPVPELLKRLMDERDEQDASWLTKVSATG